MSNLRIVTTGVRGATIELDGNDIADAVRGLRLDMHVGAVTVAELDVVVVDQTEIASEVKARIPDGTRSLLIALGWTPPEVTA
jgi:hypothetical protein